LTTEEEVFEKLIAIGHPFRYLNEHFDFIEYKKSTCHPSILMID